MLVVPIMDSLESFDTRQVQAGSLSKGDFVLIKGNPCKIVEFSTSSARGQSKCSITGVDVFTNKQYEENCASSHGLIAPIVSVQTYSVLEADDPEDIVLMDEQGSTREDVVIVEHHASIFDSITQGLKTASGPVQVEVTSAMNRAIITGFIDSLSS